MQMCWVRILLKQTLTQPSLHNVLSIAQRYHNGVFENGLLILSWHLPNKRAIPWREYFLRNLAYCNAFTSHFSIAILSWTIYASLPLAFKGMGCKISFSGWKINFIFSVALSFFFFVRFWRFPLVVHVGDETIMSWHHYAFLLMTWLGAPLWRMLYRKAWRLGQLFSREPVNSFENIFFVVVVINYVIKVVKTQREKFLRENKRQSVYCVTSKEIARPPFSSLWKKCQNTNLEKGFCFAVQPNILISHYLVVRN